MIQEALTQPDGMLSFLGGQNSGVEPNLLKPDQSAQLWNCTRRRGTLKPRPGWSEISLTFPTDEIESWFTEQNVQGTFIFKRVTNTEVRHVWAVGGRFFSIDVDNAGTVSEITPVLFTTTSGSSFVVPAVGGQVGIQVSDVERIAIGFPIKIGGKNYTVDAKSGSSLTITNVDDTPAAVIAIGTDVVYLDLNSPTIGIVYMIQAEDFLIAQDGQSIPFIWDGATGRRAGFQEVPVGTAMAYGRGRAWVATNGNKFVAGDIVYGPSGTNDYGRRDAVLKFTENTFLNGGGSFTAPGVITAMLFATVLDTSTGQGPLMIFCENSICSANAPTNREAWQNVTDPIQTISMMSNGSASFYSAVATLNGDIFYRAMDGIRSFFLARREVGTWGNTPISREISNLIEMDDPNLLKFTSAIVFDNRLLCTGASMPTQYGAYWKGLGVLDFEGLTSIYEKSPPAWEGVWTGVNISWIYSGMYQRKHRAFMAVRNADGLNELWEISKSDKFDSTDKRIKWKWYSRAFNFKSPMEMVRISGHEIFPKSVVGDVDFTLRYRPDDYPCWFSWHTQPVCADYRRCFDSSCADTIPNFRAGYKTRIPFGQPPDTDETNDGKPARLGYSHQLSLEVEGYCELKLMRTTAQEIDEEPYPRVDQSETCQSLDCCPDDNFEWRTATATASGGEETA